MADELFTAACAIARGLSTPIQPSRHTPGEWRVDQDYGGDIYSIDDGYFVCSCGNSHDARLIAAAPDLLQALKDWQNYDLTLEERQNKAMAAIAKAENR